MLKEQYADTTANSILPDMADKLQVLENQIIPRFREALRKLSELAERVGYQLPPNAIQDQAPDGYGYCGNLANSMDILTGQGESLNVLLEELSRFI